MSNTITTVESCPPEALSLREIARAEAKIEAELNAPVCFAFGRLRVINSIVSYRHGGPCRTDDGIVYFDLMLPYAVEISHLRPVYSFAQAERRLRFWMPRVFGELGADGVAGRWDELCETRSVAKSRWRTESRLGNVDWLPTADCIRDTTRLTYAERAAINAIYPDQPPIRGIGVIDPPTDAEKREIDRVRKEVDRRAKGVQSQAYRNLTAEAKALAATVGCNEKTIRIHRDARTLDTFLAKRGFNVQKVSAPYIETRGDGQILDIPVLAPEAEAMAVLKDILADPFAMGWKETEDA